MSSSYTNWKELTLVLLMPATTLTAFWYWDTLVPLITNGQLTIYNASIFIITGLVIVSALAFSFGSIFIKNNWLLYSAAIVSIILPFFWVSFNMVIAILCAASIFLIFYAARNIRNEYNSSLRFHLSKILRAGLPLYFTLMSLIFSVFYIGEIGKQNAVSTLLPKPLFNIALKTFSQPIQSLTGLPAIDPEATVDTLLLKVTQKQLESQGIKSTDLSPKEIESLIQTERSEIGKQYGLKLNGKEKVGDIFYTYLAGYIEDFLGPNIKFLPLVLVFIFFVLVFIFFSTLKAITIPLYYLTVVTAFALIKLLLLGKILKSERTQIEIERISLA